MQMSSLLQTLQYSNNMTI